jgi:hypothetical protein
MDMPDLCPFTGTGIDDARSAFAQAHIDHVIMGAGIDLETTVGSGRGFARSRLQRTEPSWRASFMYAALARTALAVAVLLAVSCLVKSR